MRLGVVWFGSPSRRQAFSHKRDSIGNTQILLDISLENINCDLFFRQNMASHYCGYELFGFDVLLDAKLKPWLIEVNISPSLHSSSPLDLDVKSPLATEVFNLGRFFVRFRFLSFFSSALNCAQRVSIFFVKSQRLLIEFPHLTSFFF